MSNTVDKLALEVIDQAYQLYLAGEADDLPECRDLVIARRWPCHGNCGVAMSQRRTVGQVRASIREFYSYSEPSERNA